MLRPCTFWAVKLVKDQVFSCSENAGEKLPEVEDLMLQFCKMDQDMKDFTSALRMVQQQVATKFSVVWPPLQIHLKLKAFDLFAFVGCLCIKTVTLSFPLTGGGNCRRWWHNRRPGESPGHKTPWGPEVQQARPQKAREIPWISWRNSGHGQWQ